MTDAAFLSMLGQSILVERLGTSTVTDDFGPSNAWATLGTYDCRLDFKKVERNQDGVWVTIRDARAHVAGEDDIAARDRVTFAGRLFDVIGVDDTYNEDGSLHHRKASLKEIL